MDQEYLDFVRKDYGVTVAREVKKAGAASPLLGSHIVLAKVLMRHSVPRGPSPACTSRNICPTFRRERRLY